MQHLSEYQGLEVIVLFGISQQVVVHSDLKGLRKGCMT